MTKLVLSVFVVFALLAQPLFSQKAPVGSGTVTVADEVIYDLSGSFEAPVLRITGTEFDDHCIVSNLGPTGLQVTLNGVDYPLDPTSYIYDSSFDGLDGDDRFVFRAYDFPSWDFGARGGDGDDFLLNVTANNFVMRGDDGDDTLSVYVADWTGIGSIGLHYQNDLLSSNPFVTTLYGGRGNDTFFGGSGGVRMYGSLGDDTFKAGGGDDLIYCGDGDDVVVAGHGNDRVYGGAGMDTIYGGPGNDWIDSGRYNSFRGYENQTTTTGDVAGEIFGGSGNDFIITGPEVDTVDTGPGQDVLESPEVADIVTGSPSTFADIGETSAPNGSGLVQFNLSYVGYSMRSVTVFGTPFKDLCIVDDNGVLLNGVRYDVYGEFYDFKGLEGDDTFIYRRSGGGVSGYAFGGSGDDLLSTRTAPISLEGNDGDDILHDMYGTGATGGAGNDFFFLADATRRTTVYGDDGDDTIVGGDNGNYINAGHGDDMIHGGTGVDTIYGGSGKDFIYGDDGDDVIDSGVVFGHSVAIPDGADTVIAGAGNDVIKTGFGDDVVIGGDGDDTIESGEGNDTVKGGAGNDIISLGIGDDWGNGDAGDDEINGGAGDDVIIGGLGVNTLNGGPGSNLIR